MSTAQEYPDRWSPQRKAAWAVFLWPLVITAAGVLFYLSFMDQLPEQVATHWSRSGPDGFTARENVPWIALIGLGTAWFTGAIILAVGAARDGTHRRLAVGFAAGLATFMVGVFVGTAWDQRGLSDGALARDVEWPLVVALLASLVVGVVAALLVPGSRADSTRAESGIPADSLRVELAPGEQGRWTALAVPGRWLWITLTVVTGALIGTGLLTGMWFFTILMVVLVGAPLLALSAFRVTVDASGLVVAGLVGLPRWRMRLEDVAEARVTQVNPLGEFGGWGYRLGLGGRTGFVVRKGPGLEVERGDGTVWVVTVDDPEQGAALLNTLADRAR